jgi:hypothetical protein
MRYAIQTPIAVFCCRLFLPKQLVIDRLHTRNTSCAGVYTRTRWIHEKLLAMNPSLAILDHFNQDDDRLPSNQTPEEWCEVRIFAYDLGF